VPAYYHARLDKYLSANAEAVLGELTRRQTGATPQLHRSWLHQIAILKKACGAMVQKCPDAGQWGLLFEYQMFRLHRRIDAVLLAEDLVIVIEFKIGSNQYDQAGITQVEDYALDLRDFHAATRGKYVIPILCASEAPAKPPQYLMFTDEVSNVLLANGENLASVLLWALNQTPRGGGALGIEEWESAAYSPVPNIIDAAEMLYAAHNVEEIHSALAEQQNLTETTDRLIKIIADAQENQRRAICFVTGVPGSGKTLVGLNAVHDPRFRSDDRPSGAFLSGNTPLVAVLREALARDEKKRTGCKKSEADRRTKAQIQLLMRYLDQYLKADPENAPHENVIVFDEAQRAWDAAYGKQKFEREASEPTLFLEIMARHQGWAVIVALVGGGQEINKGEGGLSEWGQALELFAELAPTDKGWDIYASPHVLEASAVTAGGVLFPDGLPENQIVYREEALHLPVSIRSHRCEIANAWIEAVLDGNAAQAKTCAQSIDHFPVYMTRSLNDMRSWLDKTTRGRRRCGLVASSDARRLRGYGLGVTLSTQDLSGITNWFLCDKGDVRASYQMEVTATEYACQGLELDRVGLCWGGDMTWDATHSAWVYRKFRGSIWQNVGKEDARKNIKNTYRVLMSRAREAVVIWVPPGEPADLTRLPKQMDETAVYLRECGIKELCNIQV